MTKTTVAAKNPTQGMTSLPQGQFQDNNNDCCNEESTARNDKKPIVEDKFKDDIDDCRNEESTARDDKPTARTSSKTTTTTVATKNPLQGTTSLPQKTISNVTTTTVTTKNLQ
jgi:hypothetical protein